MYVIECSLNKLKCVYVSTQGTYVFGLLLTKILGCTKNCQILIMVPYKF